MKHLVVCLLALACTTAPAASDEAEPTIGGTLLSDGVSLCFENELSSTMELVFTNSDIQPGVWQLSGQYVNNAAGTDCQGTMFPLHGIFYPGEPSTTLSFSIAWASAEQSCDASAAWTGYLRNGPDGTAKLFTRWVLALPAEDGENFQMGSNAFSLKTSSACQAP